MSIPIWAPFAVIVWGGLAVLLWKWDFLGRERKREDESDLWDDWKP